MVGAGNSSAVLNYSAKDESPFQGSSYYRLKQSDNDGTTSYSKTISISTSSANSFSFNAYTGANDQNITLSFSGMNSPGQVSISVVDLSGKTVYTNVIFVSAGNHISTIESSTIAFGIYTLTAVCKGAVAHQKLLISKEN
ncbi:MAG: T9SS type A sorting domain-containing protein [Bacteroidetes bacterium]|nr:T9SS type A sorting domain-containing protein [Bacteroidota bacterium]